MSIKKRELEVQYRATSSLTPYTNNPRRHSKPQIRQIAESFKSFGWTNPILVDGEGNVIAGHGRLEAAKLLGITEVPTICLSGLTPAEKRAYIIADNKIAENAGWDKNLLSVEFNALVEESFCLELTGFETIEIDEILGLDQITSDDAEDEDLELPDPAEPPVTQRSDLWINGDHRLLCGDGRFSNNHERLLGKDRAQMVFTDPPYNVAIPGNVSGLGKIVHRDFAFGSGEMSPGEFAFDLLRPAFRQIATFSQAGAIAFICMDWRHIRELQDAADGVFAELKNLIIFAKTNAGMGTFYRSQHELIFAFKITKGEHINNFGLGEKGRHRSNLWTYAGVNTFRKGRMEELASHPCVKPLKLVADAILDCSRPRGIILDPFLGSGTTLVAAAKTGRRGAGIELDPIYVDLCIRRLEQQTGQPTYLESGETFAAVRERRLNQKTETK
jgi:DNA modification methylase